ncbi:MAG: glycosyltransferase family 4 protein, partial [Verrucomicrobia bacterium]|nr:glycosyltransferase family 4 protein [Verrucomicrobiota bacterium]
MNILFVNHGGFASNSMGHVAGFANRLCARGHHCVVAVPGAEEALAGVALLPEAPLFLPRTHAEVRRQPELFPDGRAADVLHAWTPRENVRRLAFDYLRASPETRLAVHLEDNEEFLAARYAQTPFKNLRHLPQTELAALLPEALAHPRRYQIFLQLAGVVTGIVERLRDFVPAAVAFQTLPPGIDFSRYQPGDADPALRAKLGLRADEKILVYPGNAHFGNHAEMRALHLAVQQLNERCGQPCRLVRAGTDAEAFLYEFAPGAAPYVLAVGFMPQAEIPALLRMADVLVQPGERDEFNRYRLPSKVPEFLAIGRPVILPRCNVGELMTDGQEALLLESGSPEEIAAQCQRIFDDPALGRTLAERGAAFARAHFDLTKNTDALECCHRALLDAPANPILISLGRAAPEGMLPAAILGLIQAALRDGKNAQAEALLNDLTHEAGWLDANGAQPATRALRGPRVAAAATAEFAGGDSQSGQGECQVYYPSSAGYEEALSRRQRFPLGAWRKLVFPHPAPVEATLPMRIDPVRHACLVDIAGISVRSLVNQAVLWRADRRSSFDQLRLGGSAARVPDERLLRIFSTGGDPQIYLPRLPGLTDAGPVQIELWLRAENDLAAVDALLVGLRNELAQAQAASAQTCAEREETRAALAQARADSEQTQAQAAQAQAGLTQMQAELAQTRAELAQARAELAQTDAALRQMR